MLSWASAISLLRLSVNSLHTSAKAGCLTRLFNISNSTLSTEILYAERPLSAGGRKGTFDVHFHTYIRPCTVLPVYCSAGDFTRKIWLFGNFREISLVASSYYIRSDVRPPLKTHPPAPSLHKRGGEEPRRRGKAVELRWAVKKMIHTDGKKHG